MGIKRFVACFLLPILVGLHCVAQEVTSPVQPTYTTGFAPASKTIFFDDFTRYQNGSFPVEKWKGTAGQVLNTSIVNPDLKKDVFVLSGGNYQAVTPLITDGKVTGKYVTFECDFQLIDTFLSDLRIDFPDSQGYKHYASIDRHWVYEEWQGNGGKNGFFMVPIMHRYGAVGFDPAQWHCLGVAASEKSLDIFVDNYPTWSVGLDSTGKDGAYGFEGYLPSSFVITIKGIVGLKYVRFAQSDEVLKGDKVLMGLFNKILTGEKFVTQDIHFEVNKADIKDESLPYLDALAGWLKQNPTIKLEIAGHTDSDGDDAANVVLSQQRADAIVNKLISSGIITNRLKGVGYGESKPIKPNDTQAGKAAKRRVEFRKL